MEMVKEQQPFKRTKKIGNKRNVQEQRLKRSDCPHVWKHSLRKRSFINTIIQLTSKLLKF